MIRYEIRILRPNAKPFAVSTTMAGDFYALKRAQALAGKDAVYEVWRGMKCIYRNPASPITVNPTSQEPKEPCGVGKPHHVLSA